MPRGRKMTAEELANWKAKMAVIRETPEYRAKMSEAAKKRQVTDELRAKLRAANASPEVRAIKSAQFKGKKRSPETIAKISAAAKLRGNNGGKKWSVASRRKASLSAKGRGESHNFRVDGKGHERDTERRTAMKGVEYRLWREAVFTRDDWTCQDCRKRGGNLVADHVKSWAEHPELRYDVSNGRTLCVPCHKKTPTYGRNKPKRT